MTIGFLVSFGGILAVVVLSLIVEQLFFPRRQPLASGRSQELSDATAALTRAAGAAREIELELVRVRQSLRAR